MTEKLLILANKYELDELKVGNDDGELSIGNAWSKVHGAFSTFKLPECYTTENPVRDRYIIEYVYFENSVCRFVCRLCS